MHRNIPMLGHLRLVFPNAIGNYRSQLTSGIYTVIINNPDFADCSIEKIIVVENQDFAIPQYSTFPANCTAADGGIFFNNFTYTYLWDDGGTSGSRSDLAAGVHTVTITNPATGCENYAAITVPSIGSLTAFAVVDAKPACGQANGQAHAEAFGGSDNYTFQWTGGLNGASQSNLSAGFYNITVTDIANGCTACHFSCSN